MEESNQYIKINDLVLELQKEIFEKAITEEISLYAYIGKAIFLECTIHPEDGIFESDSITNDFAKVSSKAIKLAHHNDGVLQNDCLDVDYDRSDEDRSHWCIKEPKTISLTSLHISKKDFEPLTATLPQKKIYTYDKNTGCLKTEGDEYFVEGHEKEVFEYLLDRKNRGVGPAKNNEIKKHCEGRNVFITEGKVSKVNRSTINLISKNIIKKTNKDHYYVDIDVHLVSPSVPK